MSDVNICFDLRVMQLEDGSWSLSLVWPNDDDGFGWRHFPHTLLGAYGFTSDSWTGETLVDVMAEATNDIGQALGVPDVAS
jgi:hypothetical protein